MDDILEYYVMRTEGRVTMWLDADEHSWTTEFGGAAAFNTAELAIDIARRETTGGQAFYVMACLSSDDED